VAAAQRMKALHFILVLGLSGLFFSGCSTASTRTAQTSSAAKGKSKAAESRVHFVKGNADAFAHFAAGESYFDNEDAAGTLKQWQEAALADPSNERLVIEVAAQLMQDKNNDKALAILSKSANRTNASSGILAWLARAQLQAGHAKQALEYSKLAIQRQPNSLDGYECQVEVLLNEKQWPEASKTIRRAARMIPPDPGLLLAIVDLYKIYLKDQPKDTEAETQMVALLDRIASLNFTATRLWQRVAEDYALMNKQKKAAEIYTRLLTEFPEPSLSRDGLLEKLAGLYLQADDRTNAVKELQALIRDNPTHYPRAWFVLGELAYEGGKLEEAADDFDKALHWDPSIEQAYYDLALVQLDLHQSRAAFDTLDQARNRFPKTFSCEFYTGVIYAHVKNFTEAIRHFKEAEVIGLATDPAKLDQRFYFQFGAACERDHEYKQADEYLQKCINLAPDFAEAMNYLGYMFADLGEQLPRARALIEKAVSLEPRNGAYLDSFGWVLYKMNQPQLALPQMLKAVECTPEPDPTVFDHLAEVYLALHQTDKAIEAWKKSYAIDANEEAKQKLEQYSSGSL
jgi:tetratricopeptide (TPR) repeat protein